MRTLLLLLLLILTIHGPDDVPVKAGPGSALPRLMESPDGGVLLSWTEPSSEGHHALRYARWSGGAWSEPKTVSEGNSWFLNWADFPSVVENGDVLTAHYLAMSGPGTYSYDVRLQVSPNGGRSWSAPITPHRDGTATEHGFVSLVPLPNGRTSAIWLDGRQTTGQHGAYGDLKHAMTLRSAEVDSKGVLSNERLLDDSVCDCCQTSAVLTSEGVVAFYRNRTENEIRDIWVVREDDGWSKPAPVHEDGWHLAGCPVNGPAAAARDSRVVVSWFTAAGNSPMVKAAWSADAGRTFSEPVRIDEGNPLGRVDVTMLAGGEAAVVWLESKGREADLRVRRIRPSGRNGSSQVIATVSSSRASGVPQVASSGEDLIFAWTEVGEKNRIRTARVRP